MATAANGTTAQRNATPTPDEIAVMTADERQAALASLDINAMDPETRQAYLAAFMSPPPREQFADTMHVRRPHQEQDSGYYTSSSGHVYPKLNVEPARTFCGAPAGSDLTYGEFAQRRADYDWTALDAEVCETCLAEAAKVKAQRAAKRATRRRR